MSGDLYSAPSMIKRLVEYDTTSHKSNLALIRFVEDYLAGHDIRSHLVYNEAGDKANLFATIGGPGVPHGEDGARRGGIVLSGHSDVVPADDRCWSTDPFRCVEKDERLYGRGTCDMKGFLGVVLAAVPEFVAAPLRRPVHIALTCDEETTMDGAASLVPEIGALGFAPAAVIIGEPTEMRIVNAHKGHYYFITHITGRDAHASMPHLGVNAVTVAARLVQYLETLADEARRGTAAADSKHTTINIGVIEGGTQFNMVPGRCSLEWEMRTVPSYDNDALVRRFEERIAVERDAMRALAPEADIRLHSVMKMPAYESRTASAAELLVKRLTGVAETHAVAYCTEASYFQKGGMPVVVFGPGSIDQAHKPDEFVALSEIEACNRFMQNLLKDCAQPQ